MFETVRPHPIARSFPDVFLASRRANTRSSVREAILVARAFTRRDPRSLLLVSFSAASAFAAVFVIPTSTSLTAFLSFAASRTAA